MGCLGAAVPRRARGGAPGRPVRRALPAAIRDRYGVRNVNAAGAAPEWSVTAMVMNHYQRSKRFYVRTKVWYTTEPREARLPDHDRRLQAPAQRHGLRRAGRRRDLRRPLDVDGAVQRAHPRRRLAPPRRRDAPDARLEDLQPRAAGRQGLLRRGRPPVQHGPPDPARAGADRQRHVHLRGGHPDHRGRGARAHRLSRQLLAARGGDGLLGAQRRARRERDALRAAAERHRRGHASAEVRPQGAVRLRPRGAAAVHALRALALGRGACCRSATSSSGRRG